MSDAPLPNLLLAGVPKAATTALFWYLDEHPAIVGSKVKEPHYFTPLRDPGTSLAPVEEYAALFEHGREAAVRMEGSPSYAMGGTRVIDGIREVLGRPRVVISLREPVARFWSAYTFTRSKGNIPEMASCAEFLAECEARRAEGTDLTPPKRRVALSTGFYDEWLPRWIEAFGPDLRIVFAEQIRDDGAGVGRDLCTWLGLDPSALPSDPPPRRNVTRQARSERLGRLAYDLKHVSNRLFADAPRIRRALRRAYGAVNTVAIDEELDEATRDRLVALYAPSVARTRALLREQGYEDLPAWLQADAVDAGPTS